MWCESGFAQAHAETHVMVFAIRKLADEAIVICTVDLPVEDYWQNYLTLGFQLHAVASQIENRPLYAILDARRLEPAFSDVLMGLEIRNEYREQGGVEFPLRPILVGTHPILGICVKKAYERLGAALPWFGTLEEALAHARQETSRV
jgi:hypothetical protein